jgi:hypothetical protein
MCNGNARHAQTDACNPDLVFKDGHPHLVGLLPPVPSRLCDSEKTVTPRRTRFGGHINCKAAWCRASDAPSRSPIDLSAKTVNASPRTFATTVW